MKKIYLLFAVTTVLQPLSAQNYDNGAGSRSRPAQNRGINEQRATVQQPEEWRLDLQIAQHIGLNKWYDMAYADDGLPGASITELRGVVNYSPYEFPWLGIFFDLGLGIMPAPGMRALDIDRMPMPNSGTKYYLREMISQSGADRVSAHFKFTAGLYGDIPITEKLNIMPYLGIGSMTLSRRSYEMVLKEEGSNNQYNTMFLWSGNRDMASGSDLLGYVTGRLNLRYKFKANMNLLFGLEYTYFFDTVNFYGSYSNTFNANVNRSFSMRGNNMNMFAVSVGIAGW